VVRHVFTHFPLELAVYTAELPPGTAAPPGTRWIATRSLGAEALPSVMRKVVAHALQTESMAIEESMAMEMARKDRQ
jgi:A/G-specific adenine glycosylase